MPSTSTLGPVSGPGTRGVPGPVTTSGTRRLLACGVLAGPVYLTAALSAGVVLGFWAAVVVAWTWLALVAARALFSGLQRKAGARPVAGPLASGFTGERRGPHEGRRRGR
jgi:hypothetical protein